MDLACSAHSRCARSIPVPVLHLFDCILDLPNLILYCTFSYTPSPATSDTSAVMVRADTSDVMVRDFSASRPNSLPYVNSILFTFID
jgi:hypothetical protein